MEEEKLSDSNPLAPGTSANGDGEAGAAATAAAAAGASGPGGLQKMHSFGGMDVLEAGRVALEKRIGAVKPTSAPREGGKLTLGKYLEKARVDA